ncbi:MAG TPA: hypothetical protein VJB97_02765 [Candidatus Paceibacterota bacterium]
MSDEEETKEVGEIGGAPDIDEDSVEDEASEAAGFGDDGQTEEFKGDY